MPARAGSTSTLGELIRAQRKLANLSLRQLSAMAQVSNPYLSQVERGVHQPSVRVLRGIAEALDVSAETLLVQAGLLSSVSAPDDGAVVAAISADTRLTPEQRRTLLAVYRSYVDSDEPHTRRTSP
jgi:transcriptional regulator with XRE-family HTH domain